MRRSPPSPTCATSCRCTPASARPRAGGGWTFVPDDQLAGSLDRQHAEHHEQPSLGPPHHRHARASRSPATLPTPRSCSNTDRNSVWLPGRRKRTASPTSCSAPGCSPSCRTSSMSTPERSPAAAPVDGGYGALGLGVTPNFGGFGRTLAQLARARRGSPIRTRFRPTAIRSAPYWLHHFGDIGTAKIGYQFSESSYSQGNSYVPLFFPTGHNRCLQRHQRRSRAVRDRRSLCAIPESR